jgi:hypothetical protein
VDDWTPAPVRSVDVRHLPLGPDEGFVYSRVDGHTSVRALGLLTGLSEERVRAIVARLVELGAVGAPGAAPTAAPVPHPPRPPVGPVSPPVLTPVPPAARVEPPQEGEATPAPVGQSEGPEEAAGPPSADETEGTEETEEAAAAAEARALSARGLFETQLHALAEAERVAHAAQGTEPLLSALCFDPLPSVVRALLDNPHATLVHARLVARHHRNPVGLEALATRAALARDPQVDRWLLRNPQLPQGLARRLLTGRRMVVLYKLTVDRELPEQTRRTAREVLRSRFATGPAEERAALIFTTEGRALVNLVGLPVDGKTAAMLCHHAYHSTLFIQNLARWAACPPSVIAHLLRQELVRRQPTLKAMLQRHPNAPAEARRG